VRTSPPSRTSSNLAIGAHSAAIATASRGTQLSTRRRALDGNRIIADIGTRRVNRLFIPQVSAQVSRQVNSQVIQ
jgi:hypothetical protein